MEIYLDTAQREEIELGFALGCVAGVTTNPTILARAGTSLERFIAEVAAPSRNRTFLVQVAMGSKDDMVREAKDLAARAANLVIKIPVMEPGIAAVRTLTDLGIRTALTLVFSRTQAIAAACAGASFVAPFVGRLDDIDSDGVGLVRSIHETFSLQRAGTRIIAASVRGSGSASSGGFGCHGRRAPRGAGHGRVSFDGAMAPEPSREPLGPGGGQAGPGQRQDRSPPGGPSRT